MKVDAVLFLLVVPVVVVACCVRPGFGWLRLFREPAFTNGLAVLHPLCDLTVMRLDRPNSPLLTFSRCD